MKPVWIGLISTAVVAVQSILLLATSATGVLVVVSIIKAVSR